MAARRGGKPRPPRQPKPPTASVKPPSVVALSTGPYCDVPVNDDARSNEASGGPNAVRRRVLGRGRQRLGLELAKAGPNDKARDLLTRSRPDLEGSADRLSDRHPRCSIPQAVGRIRNADSRDGWRRKHRRAASCEKRRRCSESAPHAHPLGTYPWRACTKCSSSYSRT